MRPTRSILFTALIVALSGTAGASELKTGDIELKPGFTDAATGVKVEKVVVSNKDELQEVTVSLPQSVGTLEEVTVVAPGEKPREIKQVKRFELLKDYEHGRYGLVIYLNEKGTLPLRLYFDNEQVKQ